MSDILSLFERHCTNIKGRGNQRIALCPFHEDTKHSFSINIDKGVYNCKSCGESGNAVKFAKAFDENPKPFYSDDYQKNRRLTGGQMQKATNREKEIGGKPTTYYADKQQKDWQLFNETFVKQLPDELRNPINEINMVGMDNGCLTYPYFNDDGVMDGIKRHKPKPKAWGNMKLRWYGLWHIKHQPKEKPLYIVEGEGDVNTMKNAEFGAVVSGSGGCRSIPTIPQIFNDFKEIIVIYDNDKYGESGAIKLSEKIYESLGVLPMIAQWSDGLPNGFDCSDDYKQSKELKETRKAIKNAKQFKPTNNTKQKKEITLMSISSFMESDYEKPEIIVKNFLKSKSTTIIGGCTGVGKSWLSLNLAMSIAGGLPFMNYFTTLKKKVIFAQFELTNGEVQERFDLLKPRYWMESESIEKNLFIMPKITTYDEQWRNIEELVRTNKLQDAVLIVDNLYTSVSTDTDLSNNQQVMEVVKFIDAIANEHNLHIVVITHHLKGVKDTPILIDNILGGAALTRSASNVFQLKKSRLSNELLVGMITKNRGEQCELLEVPFKITMDNGYFERGEIIDNESLHYIEMKEKWEIQLLKKLEPYMEQYNQGSFDRDYLWRFLESEGWQKNDSNQNKITRFITRCIEWGLVKKESHNKYSVLKGVLD